MKRITFYARILLLVTILALVLSTVAFADNVGDDPINPLDIQVSPHTLNLASNGGSFTIHADVPFDSETEVNLTVGDVILSVNHPGPVVPVEGEEVVPTDCYTFADDLGDLVVKCDLETVKDSVTEGEATFVLVVADEEAVLTGEETIDVIDHGQSGNDNGGNGPGDGECDGTGECDAPGDGEGNGDGECDGSGGGPHGPGGRR